MKRLLLVLVLLPALASAQSGGVNLEARWIGGARAAITIPTAGNLYRHSPGGVTVWLGRFEAPDVLVLPDGPDYTRYPRGGDIYVLKPLIGDEVIGVAELPQPIVILPIVVRPP